MFLPGAVVYSRQSLLHGVGGSDCVVKVLVCVVLIVDQTLAQVVDKCLNEFEVVFSLDESSVSEGEWLAWRQKFNILVKEVGYG